MVKELNYKAKPKKQKTHGDLANALIEIAVEYMARNKTTEFALRDLAHKLGVSHAAAYKHYDSKNALLEAIALRGYKMMNEDFEKVFSRPKDKVLNLGKAYIQFAITHPGYYRVMFSVDFGKELAPGLHSACSDSFYALLEIFGASNKTNAGKAIYVWSVVHGFVMLMLDGQISASLEEFSINSEELENQVLRTMQNALTIK